MTVVPFNYPLQENPENISYDGIFISNGPGDPAMCMDTVQSLKVRYFHLYCCDSCYYEII